MCLPSCISTRQSQDVPVELQIMRFVPHNSIFFPGSCYCLNLNKLVLILEQGHQAPGISCMYVVPDYGIAHSPHGPHAFRPCAIGDGRFIRTQEYRTETMEHTYHQPVPTPQYAAFPTAAIRTPATAAQSLAYTNGLFVPGGLQQTVPVASERGVAWNQSVQATISPMKFQGHTMLPKEQPRRPAPWKQQFSGGAMVPTRLPHARQVCCCPHYELVKFYCSFMSQLL